MAVTKQKSTDKYHGMKPFTKERLGWGKKAFRRKCRLSPKSTLGNDPLFIITELLVLEGNNKPEKYILWLKEYQKSLLKR